MPFLCPISRAGKNCRRLAGKPAAAMRRIHRKPEGIGE
jgi:hypothetical protein